MDVIVDRVAGLDVHQKTVMAAVRTPGSDVRRAQEIKEFRTYTGDLVALRDWLVEREVTLVVMEATGVYWRPVWYVLEDHPGFELELVNPHHVKNLPGRKTDTADAAWLAQLAECGLLRGSFIPPKDISRLRDLTRYRTKIVRERVREVQRLQKLLEDANVKLTSLVTDITGVSGRAMIEALIAGERDSDKLANLARTRMRPKIGELRLALVGRFDEHHALLARMHLDHIDQLSAMEDRLDKEVDRLMAPFAEAGARLQTIPGIGKRAAEIVVSEMGVDMSRFPTAHHLASWAGLCPGNHETAHKSRSGRARKGNEALRTVLCECAWAASHSGDTYFNAQYRRFKRRFGKRSEGKAIFAVAHSLIVVAWHVLHDETTYQDLGPDYFERRNDPAARQHYLLRELQRLGVRVTVQPAA
jgi:transposase